MDSENIQFEILKGRIPYDNLTFDDEEQYEKVLNNLLDDSKYIGLSLRYPYDDFSSLELPKRYNNWQIRCCIEIFQGLGRENIKAYAENGITWTKDGGNISNDLKDEISPLIGVIIDEEE